MRALLLLGVGALAAPGDKDTKGADAGDPGDRFHVDLCDGDFHSYGEECQYFVWDGMKQTSLDFIDVCKSCVADACTLDRLGGPLKWDCKAKCEETVKEKYGTEADGYTRLCSKDALKNCKDQHVNDDYCIELNAPRPKTADDMALLSVEE